MPLKPLNVNKLILVSVSQ